MTKINYTIKTKLFTGSGVGTSKLPVSNETNKSPKKPRITFTTPLTLHEKMLFQDQQLPTEKFYSQKDFNEFRQNVDSIIMKEDNETCLMLWENKLKNHKYTQMLPEILEQKKNKYLKYCNKMYKTQRQYRAKMKKDARINRTIRLITLNSKKTI